jgi:DNA-binding transcriptional MerR regulator
LSDHEAVNVRPRKRVHAKRGMTIGEVAREFGIAASAIRYYEQAGLLPMARRESRQRRYDDDIVGYLSIIRIARKAGLSIKETRDWMRAPEGTPAARWRVLAARKREEIEMLEARMGIMKAELDSRFRCACPTLQDCALAMSKRRRGA